MSNEDSEKNITSTTAVEGKNKKIAKNTVYLYLRTFIMMLISLYTSRVILNALGEVDFGLYNIVGGVVVLFSFINSSMTTSTQRYLISSLEGKSGYNITNVFSQSMVAHSAIALLIIVLGETIGLWFVENKLNIPQGRENAAFWVYQLSLFTTVLGILRCPYNASIIAYEEMSFFAWVSIVESVLKLAVSFLILIDTSDRLILYAILIASVSLIVTLSYYIFCLKKFPAIRFRYRKDIKLLREMTLFSVWSLLGNASTVGINQGSSVILNIFYGVIINAAMGIANQITAVTGSFVSNFQTAFMPQITKSYVATDYDYLKSLILRTSRYSFLLSFIVSFPIFFDCEYLLKLWLTNVPPNTAGLARIILICSIFDALSGPLWMLALAIGNIRNYQICVSLISLSNLILLYIAAKIGFNPVFAFGSKIIILFILYVYRLHYADRGVKIQLTEWFKSVYNRIIVIIGIGLACAWIVSYVNISFVRLVLDTIIGLALIYLFGLDSKEREKAISMIRGKICHSGRSLN